MTAWWGNSRSPSRLPSYTPSRAPDTGVGAAAFYSASAPINGLVSNAPLTSGQYATLITAGVTDVRMFFDTKDLFDAADQSARASVVSGWIDDITEKVGEGFRVIACVTPSNSDADTVTGKHHVQADDTGLWADYKTFMAETAALFAAAFTPAQIALEPYNEPESDSAVNALLDPGDADTRDWSTILAQDLHAAVRAAMPGYRIIIQSANLGFVTDLSRFAGPAMLADANCSFCFHGYCCTALNHPRTATMKGVAQLPWPILDANISSTTSAEIANMQARMEELGYNIADGGTGEAFYDTGVTEITYGYANFANKAALKALAQTARDALAAKGVPSWRIINGETGMQGHWNGVGNDIAVIAAWYQSEREINDELGFGGLIAYKDEGDEYSLFEEATDQTWKDDLVQEIADALGWTQDAVYGPELMGNGSFDSDVSGWTATNSGALTWVLKSGKVTGSGGFQGANRTAVASGASGKTYRMHVLLSFLSGTSAQVAVLARKTASPPTYASAFPTTPRRVVLEFTASDTAVALEIEANNVADCVFRFDNVSVKEIL